MGFMRTALLGSLTLVALGVLAGLAEAETRERDLSWFLQRMRSVEALPELEDSHTAMASTWDRSGGNADGTDFKRLERDVDTHGFYSVQGERMPVLASSGTLTPFDMTMFGNGFSDGSILWWREGRPGDKVVLSFDAPEAGRYQVVGYFARARDYGIAALYVNDEQSVTIDCYDANVVPSGPIDMGSFDLKERGNCLTIELTGANPEAIEKHMFGLDCVVLLRPGQVAPPQDGIVSYSNARNVLLDVDGPGCLHRIFVGQVAEPQTGTRIQIFLDGSAHPVIDLPVLTFFDDQNGPFPYPLVFHKSYFVPPRCPS